MIKNIIANFVGRFWSILSSFLFIPLYIRFLGFESYSIISFTLVIAGLMSILDGGLTATLSREFARSDNTHEGKIRIFKTLETTYFIIIGFCIVSVFCLSGVIANNWLILNAFNPHRVSLFLKIISFDIGFQLLLSFYLGGLLGLEKQVQANMYQMGWGILRNGLVIITLIFVPSLEIFFIWQSVSTIIFALLLHLSLNKAMTSRYEFNFQPRIEKKIFKNIWRFAGGMLLISIVASLNTQMDKLAISKLLPIENLGYYTLAVSISMGIVVLVNPISIALLPRFTALYSSGEKDKACLLFHKVNLAVSILVFSIMTTMVFFSKELLWVWTGKMDLALHAYTFVPPIAGAAAMLAILIIPYNIAIANGYTKLNNILGLVSLFVTLPGYWIATKNYGAIGAAFVFCAVQTIIALIYLHIINTKFLNTNSTGKIYIKQILLPLALSLIIGFAFSFIPSWAAQNRTFTFIWIALAGIVTLLGTTFILVSKKDLKQLANLLPVLKRR